ncbi:MAG: MgtC/SapB family protein [Oscillospiraceae bacterium]|nr:MgtC/SapB family protein [Oscillospiraceae bacterium]
MLTEIRDPLARLLGEWSAQLTWASVILRIILSLVIGLIIGSERATKRHSAGLRTFILVAVASTIAMMLELFLGESTGGVHIFSAAAVIAIAVIAQNSVLFSSRNQIKGLTTSVALWATGVIGLTSGAGYYTVTLISFVAVIACLSIFPTLEKYLKDRSNHFEIHLELKSSSYLQSFVTTIRELGLTIDDIELNPAYANSGLSVYSIAISISSGELKKYKTHKEIIEALSTLDYVYHIEEMQS